MEPDFLTILEEALQTNMDVCDITRAAYNSNGQEGTLVVDMGEGIEYEVSFKRKK